jgi:hypothetical protein
MIDHKGDCNAQPCTCGAKKAKNPPPITYCYCGGRTGCLEACRDEEKT